MLTVVAIDKSFSASQQITCEKIKEYNSDIYDIGIINTCHMYETKIESEDVTISDVDDTVEGYDNAFNRKIKFLPVHIADSFPNLVAFLANGCSLKSLSAESFKNLSKLRLLYLHFNFIEAIDDGTFDDLKALEYLSLSKNFFSLNLCCG